MKKLLMISLASMATILGAETTEATSTTDTSFRQRLKDSPFGFKFVSDTKSGVVKGDDLLSHNRFYFDYKLSDNDTLTSETRVFHNVNPTADIDGTYVHRTVLRYRRSNILTAENNGADLGAYIGRRQYVKGQVRNGKGHYGHLELGFDVSKRIGNWSWVINPEYNLMDRSRKADDVVKDLYYLFAMGTYTLNNKWGLSLWSEAIFTRRSNPANNSFSRSNNNDTMVLVVPQLDYTITPGTMASLYVATVPFTNNDGGQFIRDSWRRDTQVGIYFQSRVF